MAGAQGCAGEGVPSWHPLERSLALERRASKARRTCSPNLLPPAQGPGSSSSAALTVLPPQSLTPGYSYCPRTPNTARMVTGQLGASWSSCPELALPQPCPFPAPHPSAHSVLTLKTPQASPVQVLVTDSPGANSKPLFSPPSQSPRHASPFCSPGVGHTDCPL